MDILGFLVLKYTFPDFLETLYFSLVSPPSPFHRSSAAFSSAKPSAFLSIIERLKIQIKKMTSSLQLCLIFCLIKQTVFTSRYGLSFYHPPPVPDMEFVRVDESALICLCKRQNVLSIICLRFKFRHLSPQCTT